MKDQPCFKNIILDNQTLKFYSKRGMDWNKFIGPLAIGVALTTIGIPITVKFMQGYGIIVDSTRLILFPPGKATFFSRLCAFILGPFLLFIGIVSLITFIGFLFFVEPKFFFKFFP